MRFRRLSTLRIHHYIPVDSLAAAGGSQILVGTEGEMQHAALAFLETQEMKAWLVAALDGK